MPRPTPTPLDQAPTNPRQRKFVARESQQEAFTQALEKVNERNTSILCFHGVGGIGKTRLQQQLKQAHLDLDDNSLYSWVDFSTPDHRRPYSAYRTLAKNFTGKPAIPFTTFGLAYMLFWAKQFPDVELKREKLPFLEEGSLLASAIDMAEDGLELIDKISGLASLTLSAINYAYQKRQENSFKKAVRDKLTALASQTAEQIEDQLALFFAYDIQQYQAKHPEKKIVIFLDTYEALWKDKRSEANELTEDEWIRNGLVTECQKVLFVICGREKIIWQDDDETWAQDLTQQPIGDLADNDAKDFLASCEINDSAIQDKIIEDSEGVPFYLDLCVDTYEQIKRRGETPSVNDFNLIGKAAIFERFMRYLDRSEQATLKLLATPRFYTAEIFSQLVEQFKTGYPLSEMQQLNSFSFIQQDENRYQLHDLMRESLNQAQQRKNKAIFQQANQLLFDYYDQQLQELDIRNITEAIQEAFLEAFYHKMQGVETAEIAEKTDKEAFQALLNWHAENFETLKDAAQYKLLLDSTQTLLAKTENKLGKTHIQTAYLLHRLADLFKSMGEYKQVEALYLQSLEIIEKALGKDHSEVAATLNNLAGLYKAQGKYDKAEPLYLRSLEIWEKALGKDHPDVATNLNNLAGLYESQGKYDKAESLYLRDLAITEKALGKDHPEVATTLNNLAGLYKAQGKYDKAEPLYLRSLKILEKALGKDHPNIASSLNNLAGLYESQGKYDKAEPLYLQSLEIREKALGKDHPDFAQSLNNHAAMYYTQGKYDKAEPLYLQSLEIREKALGKDHPDFAQSLNNLAVLYRTQGKYDKAEPLLLRTIEIFEKALGKDHPDFAQSLNNLAELYRTQGKYDKAEPLFLRSLEIKEKALGKDHPDVAQSLNNLAELYRTQGKYNKAEPLYLRGLSITEKVLGKDHPDVAISLNNLALLYYQQEKYKEAVPLLQRALTILKTVFPNGHPNIDMFQANIKALQAKIKKPENLIKKLLKILGGQ